ncbi:TPA: hypothetical protein QHB43_001181 [Aeromonas hydrophila subsp. hydrophila]|nr:hypothetical protein [Aeromonas hydrophila subsp. hydrophila]
MIHYEPTEYYELQSLLTKIGDNLSNDMINALRSIVDTKRYRCAFKKNQQSAELFAKDEMFKAYNTMTLPQRMTFLSNAQYFIDMANELGK